MGLPFGTVRFRLTAWYSFVQLVALAFFGLLVYGTFRHQLVRHHDSALRRAAGTVVEILGQHEDCAELTPGQMARLDAITRLVLIHDIAGRREVFYESPDTELLLSAARLTKDLRDPSDGFRTVTTESGLARVYVLPYRARSGREGLVHVMESLGDVDEPLHTFRTALLLMAPLALVFAFGGGYWLAGRALKPVAQLTGLARAITINNFRARLPELGQNDELGRLVNVFNEMIDRLGHSVASMRRFTSDAAHELRSPLANMQSTVDVTLGRDREPSVYRRSLVSVREEVERLRAIVDDLLVLARADAGRLQIEVGTVDLDQLARDVADSFDERARDLGVNLEWAPAGEVLVKGDERWLRLVASNLVDNAVKFTGAQPDGAQRAVQLVATSDLGMGCLRVIDTGPGLPEGDPDKVFERFFRADLARGRAPSDGFGLGLSIAASIVAAHEGRLIGTSRPGGGSEFVVSLPASADEV